MLKLSLEPQLLKNKKARQLTEEEIHPLTRKSFETALKRESREAYQPKRQFQKPQDK